jgi:CDP-glucose 4,6-dehydratase
MDAAFWAGRRVFLTGHTGFKGGWLALWLESLGAKVSGYALAPATEPSLFEAARVASGVESVLGDIRDLPAVRAAMAAARPEVVFHLAAQPLVRLSYADPVATFSTNVLGTVHVLEAARALPSVRSVVIVSSDKCYENREWVWPYREDEAMGGFDPYSASKGCTELVTAAYRRSFFSGEDGRAAAAVGSARAGNVVGGGDWSADRLVPDIVRAATAGEVVRIRNPDAVRPWQHVLDPLAGYLRLAEKLALEGAAFASGWNFGPWDSDTRPVEWVTKTLLARWGGGARWSADAPSGAHEARLLKLDSSKARTLLGWRPALDLASALAWTVDWYQAHAAGADMRAFTLDQIRRYGEVAA